MGAAPQIYAASIGIQDSIFLMLLALVVFGPRRLPEIGRQIGKLMYEFRKVSNDFKFQMEEELRAAEEADRQRKLQAALPAPAAAPDPAPAPERSAEAQASVEQAPATEAAAESGEGSSEPRRFPPQIQPPSTGEPVAAARPFRAGQAEPELPADPAPETVTGEPAHAGATAIAAEENHISGEAQPGVSAETGTHHG